MAKKKIERGAEEIALELRDKMDAYNGGELDGAFISYFKMLYDDFQTKGQMLLNGKFRGTFATKLGNKRMAILYEIMAQFSK